MLYCISLVLEHVHYYLTSIYINIEDHGSSIVYKRMAADRLYLIWKFLKNGTVIFFEMWFWIPRDTDGNINYETSFSDITYSYFIMAQIMMLW